MRYLREDYLRLRWNVIDLKQGDEVKFPEYSNWRLPGVDESLLVKWVVFMYDRHSPLIKIDQLRKRAVIAAKEAKFPVTRKGAFEARYLDIITFHPRIRLRLFGHIIEYCRLQGGTEYAQLSVYEYAIANNNEKIVDPDIDPKDLKNILDSQSTLNESVSELRGRFFQGAFTPEMEEELSIIINEENLEFSPEKIAMNKEIRESIDSYNPYGRYTYQLFKMSDLSSREKGELNKILKNKTPEAEYHFKALKDVNKAKSKK